MADCALCSNPCIESSTNYKVHTAIEEKAEIKTSFKQYEVRTRTLDPKEHTYKVCQKCEDKHTITTWVVWGGAVVLVFVVTSIFAAAGNDLFDHFLAYFIFLWLPILVFAYSLNDGVFSVMAKVKKAALKDRQETSWQLSAFIAPDNDARYRNTRKGTQIIALSPAEFEKLKKSGKKPKKPVDFCFVATAVYGNPECLEIQILRQFRDSVLLKSRVGKYLVLMYYAVGPFLADGVKRLPMVKTFCRLLFDYVIVPLAHGSAKRKRS